MPIVTQARTHPEEVRTFEFGYPSGAIWDSGFDTFGKGQQTTTSYRSGPKYASDDQAYADLSGEQLRSYIRSENTNQFDTGHEFRTRNDSVIYPPNFEARSDSSSSAITYNGYLQPFPVNSVDLFPDVDFYSTAEMDIDGSRLVNRTIPTRPEASLAQFLGELREQLPTLIGWQSFHHGITPRSTGGEYLNVQFGIKPFKRDLEKFVRSISLCRKLIKQYGRDSGNVVRRKATLVDEQTFSTPTGLGYVLLNGMFDSYGHDRQPSFLSGPSGFQCFDVIRRRIWFSGAYSYYLAESNDFLGKLERYEQLGDKLLGSRFTLETLYELTPWSWLNDWFFDASTFIGNIERLHSDNLVMRYGYVMHEIHASRTFVYTGLGPATSTGSISRPSTSLFTQSVLKNRRRATPYGFGLDVNTFSASKWAILGALGLTKAPGILRHNSV